MISDHRSDARVSVFIGGDLYRERGSDRFARVLVKDVSATGLKVETLEPLTSGLKVFIDFQVGENVFVQVPVRVERVQSHAGSYQSGLSFQDEDVRQDVRKALAKLFGTNGG